MIEWPLVGREEALAACDALARDGGFGWISAVAGTGKTYLLRHVAARAAEHVAVRQVTATAGTVAPYAAVRELLGVAAAELLPAQSGNRSFFEAGVANAAGVLMQESLVERAVALAGEPTLVIVDDVHLLDAGSLGWLDVVTTLDPAPFALLVAGRPEVPDGPAGAVARRLIERASAIPLAPLDADAIAALCRARAGTPVGNRLVDALAGTGGLPLVVTAVLEDLADEDLAPADDGVVDVTGAAEQRLSRTVPDAVRSRLESVVGSHAFVAAAAALAGPTFHVHDVGSVLGLPLHEAAAVIERFERAGVVIAESAYRFRHEHYRLAAIELVSEPMRVSLHSAYARLFIDRDDQPLLVADHLVGARATGRDAASWVTRAAQQLAPLDATASLALADRALAMSSEPNRPLTLARIRALGAVGRVQEADALARALLVDATPAEEVVLRRDLAMVAFQQGRAGDTVTEMARAVELAVDDRAHARLLAEAAFAHLLAADFATARDVAEHAVAESVRLADLVTQLAAEMVITLVTLYVYDLDASAASAQRIAALGELPEAMEATVYQPWFAASLHHVLTADFELARRLNAIGRERAASGGFAWMVPAYDALDALRLLDMGDLDDAEASAVAALGWGIDDSFGAAIWCWAFRARIAASRGEWDEVERCLAAGDALVLPGQAQLGWDHLALARARLADHRGSPERALAILTETADGFHAFGIASPVQELDVAIVPLAHRVGDVERRDRALAGLRAAAALTRRPGWSADLRASEALVAGDVDGLLAAADAYAGLGRQLRAAESRAAAASAAESSGDRTRARELASQARQQLEGCGAAGDARTLDALAGRRRGGDVPRGLGRLSRSEREVVLLVGDGLTNADIAARLYVSRRTVESHVSAAYRKLGVSNRVELARLALARS